MNSASYKKTYSFPFTFEDVIKMTKTFSIEDKVRLEKELEKENLSESETINKMVEISSHPSLLHTFKFGKHNGKRIEEVIKTDRGYLQWLLDQKLNGDGIDEDWIYTLKHYLGK